MTGWMRAAMIWLAVTLLGLVPTMVPAQSEDKGPDPIRVSLSPGIVLAGGTEMESGIGAIVQLAVERGHHRVLLRSTGIADVAGFPDGSGDGDLNELGLLYGRRSGGTGPRWSVSAGVAAVHFQRCPEEPVDPVNDPGCNTLGLPVVAEAGLGGKVVGIAIQLFGNLNTHAPFAGAGLTLPLGWMP